MKVLLDTNIILDVASKREPFYVAASKIFILTAEKRMESYITSNMITDIYYISKKHYSDEDNVRSIIDKFLKLFNIISVGKVECTKALHLPMQDYEDALISVCAKKAKCDYIITRNVKDFKNSYIKAIFPDDFLKLF